MQVLAKRIAAMVVVFGLAALSPADTIVTSTVSGVIGTAGETSIDTNGLFGTPGADLDGDSFSLTSFYIPADFSNTFQGSGYTIYYTSGVASLGAQGFAITVNGVTDTYAAAPGLGDVILGSTPSPYFSQQFTNTTTFPVGFTYFTTAAPVFGTPATPLPNSAGGDFSYGTSGSTEYLYLTPTSPSAVPLPTTLKMLAASLSLVIAGGWAAPSRGRRLV